MGKDSLLPLLRKDSLLSSAGILLDFQLDSRAAAVQGQEKSHLC
jgi:hypothetical protein